MRAHRAAIHVLVLTVGVALPTRRVEGGESDGMASSAAAGGQVTRRGGAHGSASWSNVTLATCDPTADGMTWTRKDDGRIVDGFSGRCLTLFACKDAQSVVVVDDCTGEHTDPCEVWTVDPKGEGAIMNKVSTSKCIDASKQHVTNGVVDAGEPPVVLYTCNNQQNQNYTFTAAGTIQPGEGDYSPPCLAPPCCLKADPCVRGTRGAACVKYSTSSWGWVVVISLFGSLLLYSVVTVAYQFRVQGARGGALIPNRDFWQQTASLVLDGCRFTKGRVLGLVGRGGYQAINGSDTTTAVRRGKPGGTVSSAKGTAVRTKGRVGVSRIGQPTPIMIGPPATVTKKTKRKAKE